MPPRHSPRYHIPAMPVPDDWNPAGRFETKSASLPDQDQPIEWRCHSSARGLDENVAASKILNFRNHLHKYERKHGPRPDYWAAYDLPDRPAEKLIVHQTLADRTPTLYLIPATAPEPLTVPEQHNPITQRA